MNVNDIDKNTIPLVTQDRDRLYLIFGRQAELMHKYEPIEKANGLLETDAVPVDLHDRHGQARLKNFAWRVTEELAESAEAWIIHPNDPTHALEEISDALHFLIELFWLAGVDDTKLCDLFLRYCEQEGDNRAFPLDKDPTRIMCRLEGMMDRDVLACLPDPVVLVTNRDVIRTQYYWTMTMYVGTAMNCLKNKPWKNTHMLTDVPRFLRELTKAWVAFLRLCNEVGLGHEELYRMYFLKSEVNKFRIRTAY